MFYMALFTDPIANHTSTIGPYLFFTILPLLTNCWYFTLDVFLHLPPMNLLAWYGAVTRACSNFRLLRELLVDLGFSIFRNSFLMETLSSLLLNLTKDAGIWSSDHMKYEKTLKILTFITARRKVNTGNG